MTGVLRVARALGPETATSPFAVTPVTEEPGLYDILFNRCAPVGSELEYVAAAVASRHLAGDGAFSRKCQELLERELGVEKALLTTSCTHALEMMALLLEIGPGDEVVLPSFTFVSTANAFVLRGVRPVFADCVRGTLNIDPDSIARRLTDRARAVMVVHYAGVGCDMDQIGRLCADRGLVLLEDNAHGLFGRYRGRPLGTFGALAALSFHETKNFSCGEGGALLINDASMIERAEILREKGTNRSQFFRGEVDKYSWLDVGSSYLPSELLAAFLLGQLERHRLVQARRAEIWNRYFEGLSDWAAASGVELPFVPEHCDQAYHMFYLLLPDLDRRTRLIDHLKERGIKAVFHYLPLHLSRMGRRLGGREGDCPVTEEVSDRLLRLPFYFGLGERDQDRIVEAVREFRV